MRYRFRKTGLAATSGVEPTYRISPVSMLGARAGGISNEAWTNPGVYEVSLDAAAPGASVYDAFTAARDARNWMIHCCGNTCGRPSPRTI